MSDALIAKALPPWLMEALAPCLTLTKVLPLSFLTVLPCLEYLRDMISPPFKRSVEQSRGGVSLAFFGFFENLHGSGVACEHVSLLRACLGCLININNEIIVFAYAVL